MNRNLIVILIAATLLCCKKESDMEEVVYNTSSSSDAIVYMISQENHVWGGFGSYLAHGMVSGVLSSPENGSISIERAGPYVDRATLPSWEWLVLSQSGMEWMLSREPSLVSDLVRCDKTKISNVPWRNWGGVEPEEWPPSGSPEGYTIDLPHSDEASEAMGDLWYWRHMNKGDELLRIDSSGGFSVDSANVEVFAKCMIISTGGRLFVSARAKELLAELGPIPLVFKEVAVSVRK